MNKKEIFEALLEIISEIEYNKLELNSDNLKNILKRKIKEEGIFGMTDYR